MTTTLVFTLPAAPPWRGEFYTEHAITGSKDHIPASRALVRRGEKYLFWPDFEYEEFFDVKADPKEQKNLITDPGSKDRIAAAKQRFAELKEKAK